MYNNATISIAIAQRHAPHLCIVVLPDTPRYFMTSQIKSLEVDTSQLQFLRVITACCKPGRQDNTKQDIKATNYLGCRVLRGLMLRKSLVLEHMHQSCLASIVQTLRSGHHDSVELSKGGGLVGNMKADTACSWYQKQDFGILVVQPEGVQDPVKPAGTSDVKSQVWCYERLPACPF